MENSKDWLYGFFLKRNNSGDSQDLLSDGIDIFDAGLIDSLGIVELLTGIESRFGVVLTADVLEDSRFNTIQGIAELIEEQLRDRQ